MKTIPNWKTFAGLTAAAAIWLRLAKSEDPGPPPTYIKYGKPSDPCPPGQYRGAYDIIRKGYVCIIPGTK